MSATTTPFPRAVIFDAYGTLFDVAAPVRQLLGDHADAVSELWRRKQLEYSWLRSLMGRHADFAQVTANALAYAMEVAGISDEMLANNLLAAYRKLPAYDDAKTTLAKLRAMGLRLAILSNGSPDMLTPMVEAAGLTRALDMVLSVEDAGVFKPHPRVYSLACEKFALKPADIGFVSANGWDAAGAASFGFAVAWLNRRHEPVDRLPATPATQLRSLSELVQLFEAA